MADDGRSPWANNIVGHGELPVSELVGMLNEKNWKYHSAAQHIALRKAIGEAGFIRSITVNRRTGRVVDGEERILLANDQDGPETLPVEFIDVSEEQENFILATIDPLGALAIPEPDALAELIESVGDDTAALIADVLAETDVSGLLVNLDEVEFPEYDESIADNVEFIECPKCGHKWPK